MTKTGTVERPASLKAGISRDKTVIIKTKYELFRAKHFQGKLFLIQAHLPCSHSACIQIFLQLNLMPLSSRSQVSL